MSFVKPATAKSYLGAIRSFHLQTGIDTSGIDDARIPIIFRGGKRIHGQGPKRTRYPLTADILLRLVCQINDDEEGTNVKAALCVAFAAFLRSGDITWDTWFPNSYLSCLSRRHVAFHTSSVTLTLPSSKTDQFRVGTEIYLACSPRSPLCPVTALRSLFNRYPTSPHFPLFARPFTWTLFVLTMHQLLLDAGITTFGYSGHSLRRVRQSRQPAMGSRVVTPSSWAVGEAMLLMYTLMNVRKLNIFNESF